MRSKSWPPVRHWREWLSWVEKEGNDERSAAPGGHPEGRLRPDVGRDARRLEGRGPAVRGLGDLPRQCVPGRRRPAVRVPVHRVARPGRPALGRRREDVGTGDRKSTRLNSSHLVISYAVFCLKKNNRIGPPAARESYLAIPSNMDAARQAE